MWGLLAFVFGILFGLLMPGRESKLRLMINGILIGIVLAVVLYFLGGLNGVPTGTGMLGVIVGVFILTLLFVLGCWIGDLLEGAFSRRRITQ